jgi:hypothetical protein
MPRQCEVTLGETKYVIPALNMDQLERVMDIYTDLKTSKPGEDLSADEKRQLSRLPFAIIRIALERCETSPGVKLDIGTVSPGSLEEVREAMKQVVEMSGLKQQPTNPPATPAAIVTPVAA